jgi:hypothetical protein
MAGFLSLAERKPPSLIAVDFQSGDISIRPRGPPASSGNNLVKLSRETKSAVHGNSGGSESGESPRSQARNPWRYWTISEGSQSVEKKILDEGQRVIRVTGDFGRGTSLKYDFGAGVKLDRGRYRFTFRARGTPGQEVEFELADDWRGLSKVAVFPLTSMWKDHRIDFEIKSDFKDSTTLRFNLPRDEMGSFDLLEPRLKRLE